MEVENSGSGLYKPPMGADGQTFDEDAGTLELPDVDQCGPIHDMDDLQLVGVPVVVDGDSVVGGEDAASTVDVEVKAEVNGGGKRKRGRPPRGQQKPPPPPKSKNEEEDVCFICFDGGSLVLCDRRGCPKAYHPTCIKRDEAFFRSKARWNCGWHICSICQKAAHFMCYTCTYSLCKGCTKDADYVCVRGDKGFCTTCMRTVMLIENNEQGSNEMAQVDFDDKSSWEYLFKVYWIYLKEKLSLTLTELAQAKNPLQGAGTTMVCKGQSPGVHCGTNDGKRSITNSFSGCLETNTAKRRKTREQPKILNKDSLTTEKTGSDNDKSLIGCTEWATKELLEFVSLMKNGDTSVLSQFDVQALLLDYVKINNLRDPHRKSQIICDLRLKNMFGKPRVGHFEMLKLLEFHFFIKEEPQKDVFIQVGVADAVASQVEADGNNDNLPMMSKDKKRKTRRKGEERAPQTNLDEYAAIDVHNINLIYLRRNLMESLLEENEKFHDKVVGSIVRIRISSGDQKQDMYRLVQVVGTTKVAVPYKIGNKTTDAMLKVLNLDKKEDILVDAISNQDFSEEECRRLRQSIRCGLVKRLTVGEILEKAMALQSVKLNDWLETEIMRLSHLRDRASEKGRKKELRECVEKIQLLKTPEERQYRLREIPEVHSDPNMDPNYQSEEDAGEPNDKKQGEYVNPRYSAFGEKGGKPISQRKRGGNSTTFEQRSNICTTFYPNKEVGATKALERVNEGKDAYRSNSSERRGNEVNSTGSEIVGWNNQAVARSSSFARIASETSTTLLSKENTLSANNSETDKLWHYRDPNGKIQGPFSMVQLQKWSTTGYFPPDMRIWMTCRPDDSLLLTDALSGQLLYNISLQTREVGKGHRTNPNHGNSNSHGIATAQIITGGQSNVSQSNTQGSSGQSSGQNWKFFPNNFNSDSSFACVTKSTDSPEQNGEVNIQDLPSPTPKTSNEDLKEQPAAENKPSVPSKFPVQDSGPSGSSASSLVVGGAQLPEIADEWGGYSPTPLKPSVEAVSDDHVATPTSKGDQLPNPSPTHPASYVTELIEFSTLAEESVDLLAEAKPSVEAVSDDHVATPTSKGDQLPYSSPTHPASYVTELIEFSTLAEESVSDLLAEVDAMESQGGLASPTSVMNCSDDFIYNPKDDCFSSIEEFSPTPDPGKSDALSSTGDIQLPSQSTITDEPVGASRDDVFDPVKRSSGQSSPSTEVDGNVPANQGDAMVTGWGTMQQSSTGANVEEETKPTYVPCAIQHPAPFTMRQDKVDTDIADRAGSEVMDIGRDTMQGSSTRAKAEGETKSSDVSGNQEGSSLHLPAPFTLRQDFVDTDIAHRAGSEDVDTGWGAMNQSSTRAEVGGETQSADVFVNQEGAGSSIHPSAPFATSQYMVDTNVAQRVGSEAMDIGWTTMQGNINLGWGRSTQGNMNHSALSGSLGWENQRKDGGERFTGSTDRVFQGGISGFSRANKNSWSRQSFGGAGGGGNSRSPSKGQRVCKFYESGHCKKGASCSYLHP